MITLTSLHRIHKSRPAAVLGGGPSLPSDLARLPENTVLIAVNNHALNFCAPDFMVFMDIPNQQILPELGNAVETFVGLKVSQTPLTDVELDEVYWDGGFSSALATWFACYLGCDPVILCGMDCYQGEIKYAVPRPDFYHPVMDAPLEDHLKAWRPALERCPHPERIRAMSGPLIEIFGQFSNL